MNDLIDVSIDRPDYISEESRTLRVRIVMNMLISLVFYLLTWNPWILVFFGLIIAYISIVFILKIIQMKLRTLNCRKDEIFRTIRHTLRSLTKDDNRHYDQPRTLKDRWRHVRPYVRSFIRIFWWIILIVTLLTGLNCYCKTYESNYNIKLNSSEMSTYGSEWNTVLQPKVRFEDVPTTVKQDQLDTIKSTWRNSTNPFKPLENKEEKTENQKPKSQSAPTKTPKKLVSNSSTWLSSRELKLIQVMTNAALTGNDILLRGSRGEDFKWRWTEDTPGTARFTLGRSFKKTFVLDLEILLTVDTKGNTVAAIAYFWDNGNFTEARDVEQAIVKVMEPYMGTVHNGKITPPDKSSPSLMVSPLCQALIQWLSRSRLRIGNKYLMPIFTPITADVALLDIDTDKMDNYLKAYRNA